jgi:hypothetical protein
MPTLAIIGPYRFFFFSNEAGEPPHVHVKRDRGHAKYWLVPAVELAKSRGFPLSELTTIGGIVAAYRHEWIGKWNEYFNR